MIDAYLVGDAEVVRKLESLGPRMREELKAGIGRAVLKLQREVRSGKLSGQVLKVRTGNLRRSIDQAVTDTGSQVVGMVSTNVKYARAHEYGFKGVVTVKQHMRLQKQAFGRPISPREVSVSQHTAKMNLPARSFLRSALADMEASGEIRAEFEAAVSRALT